MSVNDKYSGVITASGVGAGSFVMADTPNCDGAYVVFSGTHAGITAQFEGTVDGINWVALGAYRLDGSASAPVNNSQALTTNGSSHWYLMVGAFAQTRVRASAFTSGSLNVSIMTVNDADPVLGSTLSGSSTAPAVLADGQANPTVGGQAVYDESFNGTTWDRLRNNWGSVNVDTSAARTTSATGNTSTNYNHAGAFISYNVTAVSGTTPTLQFRVQYTVDGSNFFDMDVTNAVSPSITGTGLGVIKVYPGIPTVAAGSCNSPLPRVWRLAWTIGGTAPSFTFNTNASYIL